MARSRISQQNDETGRVTWGIPDLFHIVFSNDIKHLCVDSYVAVATMKRQDLKLNKLSSQDSWGAWKNVPAVSLGHPKVHRSNGSFSFKGLIRLWATWICTQSFEEESSHMVSELAGGEGNHTTWDTWDPFQHRRASWFWLIIWDIAWIPKLCMWMNIPPLLCFRDIHQTAAPFTRNTLSIRYKL